MKVLTSRPRRLLIILLSGLLCVSLVPAVVMAAGVPAGHDADGRTFGGMVSELAKSYPGAVADHVADCDAMGTPGGMLAIHGVDGRTFGGMVSELATSYPGAIADHVAGCDAAANPEADVLADQGAEVCAGGVPAAHPWEREEFGRAVSDLATGEPGAVAAHVAGR